MSLRNQLRSGSSSESGDVEVEKTSAFEPSGRDKSDSHPQVGLPTPIVGILRRSCPHSARKEYAAHILNVCMN